MPKKKSTPRSYVIFMRVSGEEKSLLQELTRRSRQSVSNLMREAMMQVYAPVLDNGVNQR